MKRKIAIISYTTYPGQSPRALRTHELSKELAAQGHDVIVYSLTGGYDYNHYNKENSLKVHSLGKTRFIKAPFSNSPSSLTQRILFKLFNKVLAYPSIELVFNVYRALSTEILNNENESNVDLLITIAAPHSIHWGTAFFKRFHKKNFKKVTWVADCGDPFMGNHFLNPPVYFTHLENLFLNQVDYVTVPIKEAISAYSDMYHDKFRVIPQGFSFSEKKDIKTNQKNKVPLFIYAGTFYENLRDPRPLLDHLVNVKQDFRFVIYTKTKSLLTPYANLLGKKLHLSDYIPRDSLIKEMSKADFLINLENPNSEQSPSKLIDYALSGSPVLSIKTNDPDSVNKIDRFLVGDYAEQTVIENIDDYNVINVAKKFLNLNKY